MEEKKHGIDWSTAEGGHEVTRSVTAIAGLIEQVRDLRITLTLHHPGFMADNIILGAVDATALTIGMPGNWPGTAKSIRIDFKGVEGLRHYFYSSVQGQTEDSLLFSRPVEIFRLQLRSYPRVELPLGSSVSFVQGKIEYKGLQLKDISAGGMHFVSRERPPLNMSDLVSRIVVVVPSCRQMTFRSGKIMHVSYDSQKKVYGCGLQLSHDPRTRESLAQFVRLREQELLGQKGEQK